MDDVSSHQANDFASQPEIPDNAPSSLSGMTSFKLIHQKVSHNLLKFRIHCTSSSRVRSELGISFNGIAEHKVLITQQAKLPPLSKKLSTIKKADVLTSAFT